MSARRLRAASAVAAACAAIGALRCGGDAEESDERSGTVVPGGGGNGDFDARSDVLVGEAGDPSRPSRPTVPIPGAGFAIDVTEVTNGEYDAFVAAVGASVTHERAECAGAAVARAAGCAATSGATLPVNCVSWCAAFAYCKWVGKRLCGAVAGGPADFATRATTASQWTRACGGDAPQAFPYGASFNQAACNTAGGAARAVGEQPTCEGSVAGLFDMSGNLAEWEDACDAQGCSVRGGHAASPAADQDARCTALAALPRVAGDAMVGFRCCAP